jgi:hypothetical protein
MDREAPHSGAGLPLFHQHLQRGLVWPWPVGSDRRPPTASPAVDFLRSLPKQGAGDGTRAS